MKFNKFDFNSLLFFEPINYMEGRDSVSGIVIAEPIFKNERERITTLEQQMKRVIQENQILKKDNDILIDSMKGFAKFTGDDYQWIQIKKVCLTAGNPRMNDNPFSGEVVTEKDMKCRMMTQNYWGCYISEDGKCYYTVAKYRYILASLVPVPLSKDEKSVFYIRIPKRDIETYKEGFGNMNNYRYNKYHGGKYILLASSGSSPVIAADSHRFICRGGELRNIGYDVAVNNHNLCVLSRRPLPFTGETDNIQIPVEYYCTNCKCIQEGVGWKMYECMGH